MCTIDLPKNTKICPACHFNHDKDVRQKDRRQERIRVLRRAIKNLCNGDRSLELKAIEQAENELFT